MKKTFTKILSVVLCAVMVLGAAPLGGLVGIELPSFFDFKAEAATYSGTCGDDLTWSLDTSTGVLNITGFGAMDNYDYISVPWRSYYSFIETINVASGVTSIGEHAFYSCDLVTEITIGNSVKFIGADVFPSYNCKLANITVSSGNKYFSNDSYGVLFNKDKTKLVHFPSGNKITSYIIPDSVTTIATCAFTECKNLTNVIIPDNVTTIENSAFSFSGIRNVTIPGSVTNLSDYAFYWCNSLANVTIGNGVKHIGDFAFTYCNSLVNINIPDSVLTIGEAVLFSCDNLTSITIPDSVTNIGNSTFSQCVNLTGITVSADNEYYLSDSKGVLFNKDKTTLIQCPGGITQTSYIIPDSVKTIPDWAFSDCARLESITIPDSVVTIGDLAFDGCINLKDVYYNGIEKQWNKISIGSDNECLTNANIHFKDISDDAVIPAPSQTTIKYGDSIILHVDPAKIPEGGYVEWVASNNNFTFNVSNVSETCKIKPSVSGSTTFTATVYDKDGKPISIDEQFMTSKAGFFDKLIAFFKSIFGLSKVYEY